MKLFAAFLRLIRWPNLVFIALTQWLFYFCIVQSLYINNAGNSNSPQNNQLFYLLMAASVFIAAAGYIINDYFDLKIDSVNKPDKVVVDRVVKRRWAIMWHLILSAAGMAISAYISYKTRKWIIFPANVGCVLLLWLYSTTFKRKLLIGNIIIAALTAWVIVVVYFYAGATLINYKGWLQSSYPFYIKKLYKYTILFAGFAFVVSLIREVVKDIEDMYGDAQYQCKTMPIEWGVPAAKVFVAVWIVVCIGSLSIIQLYAWQSGWWYVALYIIAALIVPLMIILRKLFKATTPPDYHRISSMVKLVMLAGIVSMVMVRM
ncbi:MAG: geranylgeranylglycerol-phosphate geranylgeranyltransferase [Bacteroidetes bacterium]|nr:geranylgeranylglycerol-phosphate geranylgeranyltransferase [Bacteroidota bacterium]